MPKKPKKLKDNKLEVLPDGRVKRSAYVYGGKSRMGLPWQCACRPEDGHDHEKTLDLIATGLDEHEDVIDSLQALVGSHGITDCHIRPLGPLTWELYVSWTEGEVRQEYRVVQDRPSKLPVKDEILQTVLKSVEAHGQRMAKANRVEQDFLMS